MTKSEKFIRKMAKQIGKRLPRNMELLEKEGGHGLFEINIIGSGKSWPEATIGLGEYALDNTRADVTCSTYIWPRNSLPEIVIEELNAVARKKFPLSDIQIPFSKLQDTDISKIIADLYDAFYFYIEKVKECHSQQLESEIRKVIKKSLKI